MARNYAKEYANYHSRPEQIKRRSARNKARRLAVKIGKAKKVTVETYITATAIL